MRIEAKGYFLKEYGSWSVLIVAYLIGIGVCKTFTWTAIPLFLALGLLINSKQAYTKWSRRTEDRKSLIIFVGHIAAATIILLAVFGSDIPMLLPLLVFPLAYLMMNKFAGEHSVLTELLGFTLLSLSAVLAKFLLTGGVDVRLFAGTAAYFTAGVFKVKALLLKKMKDRILTMLDIVFAVLVYQRMHIPVIILLPLVDNLIASVFLYKVKLRTTGWIEVGKSLIFLALFIYYY
ncbi:MAG TPA: YwiC-like family protein [Nitrospirota bacterium]|nr:YwiC-like family protein [Nitrospirota bacterium]